MVRLKTHPRPRMNFGGEFLHNNGHEKKTTALEKSCPLGFHERIAPRLHSHYRLCRAISGSKLSPLSRNARLVQSPEGVECGVLRMFYGRDWGPLLSFELLGEAGDSTPAVYDAIGRAYWTVLYSTVPGTSCLSNTVLCLFLA